MVLIRIGKMLGTIPILVWGLVLGVNSQNLLKNGDFESTNSWDCWGIKCEVTSDHFSGQHAVKVTDRKFEYEGPSQYISVQPNSHYTVSGLVKLLNDNPQHIGQMIGIGVEFTYQDNHKEYLGAASIPMVSSKNGFIHLSGDFSTPPLAVKTTRIYYNGPVPGIDFIVDATTVNLLPTDPSWRAKSDATINNKRKSNINFHVKVDGGIDPHQVQIQITQTKKSFPFGTAVASDEYLYGHQQYRDFLNKHFNWGTLEGALKWPANENVRGHLTYDLPVKTIAELRKHGIKVRAHNIIWSVPTYIQNWVKALSGSALRQAVSNRVHSVMNKVKGLVEHWDVNNENLHAQWFQDRLHDGQYNLEVFRLAHHTDPKVHLFLNEYDVVARGAYTQAYKNQADHFKASNTGIYGIGVQGHFTDEMPPDPTLIKAYKNQADHFKASNTGIYGIGVQGHFTDEMPPDPTLIKTRLDLLAQTGLPIWITELDVMATDENKRAQFYETALRSLYGHPAVEGIIFWGFWSKRHWRGDKGAMVNADFSVNAAGRKVIDLLENQWMTHETRSLSKSGDNYFTVHGFHGDYQVKVMYQGHEVQDQRKGFTLGSATQSINFHVHK